MYFIACHNITEIYVHQTQRNMPSCLHEQTLARTVHRYKMGFAAKAVCQIQVKLYYKIMKTTQIGQLHHDSRILDGKRAKHKFDIYDNFDEKIR
jgi:hypothetical protein